MKYYIFKRADNNFKDILDDPVFKGKIYSRITWYKHIMVGFDHDLPEDMVSYIFLKYGDDVVDFKNICKDRTPIRNKDYISKEEIEHKRIIASINNKLHKEDKNEDSRR